MEFSRQEYWSDLPFLSLRDFPNPQIKLRSPTLQTDSLPSEPSGERERERVNVSLRVRSCLSVRLFATPWTIARQAPLSIGFSRQEYWSGLPCPHPRDLPDPGIKSVSFMSPAPAGGFFTTRATCETLPSLGENSDVTQSRGGPRTQIPQAWTVLC